MSSHSWRSGDGVNWRLEVLPSASLKALNFLATQKWLKQTAWYLAGGTAMALQVGHRSSVDLDFFSPKKFDHGKLVANFPKKYWKTSMLREGTVYGALHKAKVSFIYYPFFVPQKPLHPYGTVKVLDEADVAVMKIVAISQRGRKRDFVDLYWHCRNREPLTDVVKRLPKQYPNVSHNYHHVLKSLTYFSDADVDPMPEIYFPANWEQIKAFFQIEAPKALTEFLGLQ
ncbi:MAG: nucleotidyl transferase AbiEii/AbiGii toxin family protein [Candidatus Doudnabacteria bacterium]|nr:nucleotidyl transferase AbiEii/AbiGii toxin family protein [Candidatus Doudnabacteria bacterium]